MRCSRATLPRVRAFVAAAGNGGPKEKSPYPAAYPGVIAVAAVDAEARPWAGGTRGEYILFAAPGVDVWLPVGQGRYFTGTSYAAAFVTAWVAQRLARGQPVDAAPCARRRSTCHPVGAMKPQVVGSCAGRRERHRAGVFEENLWTVRLRSTVQPQESVMPAFRSPISTLALGLAIVAAHAAEPAPAERDVIASGAKLTKADAARAVESTGGRYTPFHNRADPASGPTAARSIEQKEFPHGKDMARPVAESGRARCAAGGPQRGKKLFSWFHDRLIEAFQYGYLKGLRSVKELDSVPSAKRDHPLATTIAARWW